MSERRVLPDDKFFEERKREAEIEWLADKIMTMAVGALIGAALMFLVMA